MTSEEVAQEKSQILDKLLILRVARIIGRLEIKSQWDDLGNSSQNFGKHLDQLLIVIISATSLESSNLSQTLQSNISEFGHLQKSLPENVDNGRLENIAKRNPVKESKKCFEGGLNQTFLGCAIQDFVAKLENGWKLGTHRRLQILGLGRSHLFRRIIENLLR